MFALRSLLPLLFLLCNLLAIAIQGSIITPFGCTGGSIYFSAHPVDVLLFENPDLYHDLFVIKCVTTVVFTSGDRGLADDVPESFERGLGEAYSLMAGSPVYKDWSIPNNTKVQLGEHEVDFWSPRWTPNVHIVYIRLPDGGHVGEGYDIHGGESMRKLYDGEIQSINTTDGNITYALDSLKDLIATIIRLRQPNDIKTLAHQAAFAVDESDRDAENADHIISAQLVMDVVEKGSFGAGTQAYAGNVIRSFEANLNATHRDYHMKAQAFFQYARQDQQMCQSITNCTAIAQDENTNPVLDNDVKYVAQYLEREYHAT